MSILSNILNQLTAEHANALNWFHNHAGQTIPWSEIKGHVDLGARLVNQAKGIYKPHYTEYALSVRQTLDNPYADKSIEMRSDGSWVYPYFQENHDPRLRDREATNRGLMKCMADGVPIGVMLQAKPKPGVEYKVLGLAFVSEWRDGYFILEGFSNAELDGLKSIPSDAAHDRAIAKTIAIGIDDFSPSSMVDARKKIVAEVVRRGGQSKFRSCLIQAYEGKCAITGCDALDALEAAHITPYMGNDSNHLQNGLLLRADIHSLFDLGLLAIDPASMKVVLSGQLLETSYAELMGKSVRLPSIEGFRPSKEAIKSHYTWSGFLSEHEM